MKENAYVLALRIFHQFVGQMVKHMIINAWLNVLKRLALNIATSDQNRLNFWISVSRL